MANIPGYQNFANAYPGGFTTTQDGNGGYSVTPNALDATNALGNLAVTMPGYFLSNNQANNGYNAAVGASAYNPTAINGPMGSVTSDGSGGYNMTAGSQFAPFQSLATNAGNYANQQLAGPNQYDTSANSVMGAFNNFNPNQFAQNEYGQLQALTQPGQTNQTQQMLNYEQASGRGGLTQNGQLGDLGGLALAQGLQNTNNALQATTDARNQGNYLANLATTFQNQGNQQRAQGMNIAQSGLNNTLGINNSLQQMLQNSINNSAQRAHAGAVQGSFSVGKGLGQANATGNLFGSAGQMLMNGGANSPFSQMANWAKGMFNGGDPNGGLDQQQLDTIQGTDFNNYQYGNGAYSAGTASPGSYGQDWLNNNNNSSDGVSLDQSSGDGYSYLPPP